MHSRRSPEFLLAVFGIILVVCLTAVLIGHIKYTTAEKDYVNHLNHVVIRPRVNVKAELEGYAQTADKWLRIRTAASILAAGAVIGVCWQVVRRRNERVRSEQAEA